jgi:hypothetical protein
MISIFREWSHCGCVKRGVVSVVKTQDYLSKFFTGYTSESEQRAIGLMWTRRWDSRVRV